MIPLARPAAVRRDALVVHLAPRIAALAEAATTPNNRKMPWSQNRVHARQVLDELALECQCNFPATMIAKIARMAVTMDQDAPTLAQLASREISIAPGSATVGDAAAAAGEVAWLVVTDVDQQPIGIISGSRLARASDRQQVGELIRHPAIVLPANLSVAESLRSWPFHDLKNELADLDGVIVVADDNSPVGVWAGASLDRRLPPPLVRGVGYADTGLPGPISNIGRIVRICRFMELPARTACAAVRSFSTKPVPLPACQNPRPLTPHEFKW
jgi:hypothetical protein